MPRHDPPASSSRSVPTCSVPSPRERSRFEEHLAACAACRNEVAELAGIPALLGKVSLSDLVASPPASAPDLPRIEIRPDPVPEPLETPGTEPGPGGACRAAGRPAVGCGRRRLRQPAPASRETRSQARHGRPLQLAPQDSVASPQRPSWRCSPQWPPWRSCRADPAQPPGRPPPPRPHPPRPATAAQWTLIPTVAGVRGSLLIAGSRTGSVLRLSMGGVRPGTAVQPARQRW